MDYYYINTTTEYDEVMNWNGEAFVEYSADVEGIKQYETMEQALAYMQVEDAKQMKRATTQYGVNWGLVF
nr:MAG TPA: hypothetical protein [Caudoviricetes sp.]